MTKMLINCLLIFAMAMVLPGISIAGSLIDNGNGTVNDVETHLLWQQGENNKMTWEAALSYCEGLSLEKFDDWRLPNIKEFSSLIDETKDALDDGFINTTFFPRAHAVDGTSDYSDAYWSSTTFANGTSSAWAVAFVNGALITRLKANSYYVRCVRG